MSAWLTLLAADTRFPSALEGPTDLLPFTRAALAWASVRALPTLTIMLPLAEEASMHQVFAWWARCGKRILMKVPAALADVLFGCRLGVDTDAMLRQEVAVRLLTDPRKLRGPMPRVLLVSVAALLVAGCSGDPSLRCGDGTHEVGGECVPITDAGIAGKRFFTTSSTYSADLKSAGGAADGLSGADALCQRGAESANLGGEWKAFISSNGQGAIDRIDDVGPWFDLQGRKVFNNKANLATTPLKTIAVNENGEDIPEGNAGVWTGSRAGGIPSGSTCSDWTDDLSISGKATFGTARGGTGWLDLQDRPCNDSPRYHLYCIEK